MTDDLISRQAAIDALNEVSEHYTEKGREWHPHVNFMTLAIYELPSAQQWIPVSERLPEVNTRCLCTYEHKEGTCIDFGLYMKNGWFVSGVTAWIPLPEPYKKEESDDEVH